MIYKVVDIANQVFVELGQPTDISIAFLAFYFRNNLGKLNSLIDSCYDIDSTTLEITPDINDKDKAVYIKMYEVVYFGKKTLDTMGAAGLQSALSVTSDGATVRIADKNVLSKGYLSLKNSALEELKQLLNAYKQSNYQALQVLEDGGGVWGCSETSFADYSRRLHYF